MKSPVIKRSIVVFNHKTSASLEDIFWQHLKFIAAQRDMQLNRLFEKIESERKYPNFSCALRMFVLDCVFHYTDDDRKAFLESQQPSPPAVATQVKPARNTPMTARDWRKLSRIIKATLWPNTC